MSEITDTGFVWHELMTPNTAGAQEFYREVAGLTATPGPYRMLIAGGQNVGGLIGPTPDGSMWPSGGPEAHWVPYIGVADVDAAAERARELGGEILVPPTDIPGYARVAVLRDPHGATFGISRFESSDSEEEHFGTEFTPD